MIINVRVQTNSSRSKLEKLDNGDYKAYVNAPPEDNRANKELIELMARSFMVKRYNIEIVTGLTSRDKVVKIDTGL